MSNPAETPIPHDQDELDQRFYTMCNLDSFLSNIPMDPLDIIIVSKFWSTHYPFFNPRSGATEEQKRKEKE